MTGYEVLPGNAALVHHVVGYVVDPNAMSNDGTKTNFIALYENPMAIPSGQESFKFTWERSGSDYGFAPGLSSEIVGVFPHMHERGKRYTFEVAEDGGEYTCQGRINRWEFNWQRCCPAGAHATRCAS